MFPSGFNSNVSVFGDIIFQRYDDAKRKEAENANDLRRKTAFSSEGEHATKCLNDLKDRVKNVEDKVRNDQNITQDFLECFIEQECIPVGCVPAARRPYAGVCFPGGGGVPGPGGRVVCLVRGVVCRGGVIKN